MDMNAQITPPPENCSQAPSLQEAPGPHDTGSAPRPRHRRVLAWVFSIATHLTVFTALFWPHAANPPSPPEPVLVNLVELPKPEEPPGPPGPPGPLATKQVKTEAPPKIPRPSPPHHATPTPDAQNEPAPDTFSDVLNESDLAGAASAGEEGAGGGGGGGSCDMARAVQQALRRDPLVRTAVEDANRRGKAIMLWNGDWVRSGVQDGKGLSAVREAVMWEVAFAPESCRNRQVHGLVLLSLADGATRFAIGSGDWRWSDLLGVQGIPSVH
jgi:hypothetical protein